MKHPLSTFLFLLASLALASALLGSTAMAADPAMGGSLVLRGAGTRSLDAQALYTATLYVAPPQGEARQLQVVVARDVEAAEVAALLTRGLVANASDEELARLIPELFALGEVIGAQRRLSAGDGFQIISNADHSTTIRIQSHAAQPVEVNFAQPELFAVMLRIWLGPQPADPALKLALSGGVGVH